MRSAALAPTIQHDYTNEIVFAMADVAEQKINFLDDAFTIIDLKDFKHRSAFTFPTPQAAEAFWYNLFGMVDANDPMTGHYPCYLTQESCDQILKAYPQFLSGIDYKHLPKGFFIAKNPQQGGVRNILHYSSYLAKHGLQAEDPLAVVLSDKTLADEVKEEKDALSAEPLNHWYTFLSTRCTNKDGIIICTQAELRAAFIRFVNIIQSMDLEFYVPDFSAIANTDFNPIVLLGRWETIMTNPALRPFMSNDASLSLKPNNLTLQWEALTQLDCTTGYGAQRAISDYQSSGNPCTILLPEMLPSRYGYCYSQLNNISDTQEASYDIEYFWRFLSFQPNKNSITFYKACLMRIREMSHLTPTARENILKILLDCTTGFNRDSALSEEKQLKIWQTFCNTIETIHSRAATIMPVLNSPEHISRIQAEALSRINQFSGFNIQFLQNIADTCERHLSPVQMLSNQISSGDPLKSLDELSRKICKLTALNSDFYTGAKFYFRNGTWEQGLSLESYTELQYQMKLRSSLAYSCVGGCAWDRVSALHELLGKLMPFVSTFSINSKNLPARYQELGEFMDFLRGMTKDEAQKEINKLVLIWEHFSMAAQQLDDNAFSFIIQGAKTIRADHDGEYDLPIIDYLKNHFSGGVFPPGHLDKKKNAILEARQGNLDETQMTNIRNMGFSPEINSKITKTESFLIRHYRDTNTETLEEINKKFGNCDILLSETDFDFLTDKIAETADNISILPPDEKQAVPFYPFYTVGTVSLDQFLQTIANSGSTEAFSRIYYVNKNVRCQSPDIFFRFYRYVSDIRNISRAVVGLSRIISEDLLAKFVLNANPQEITNPNLDIWLYDILRNLETATTAHPHTMANILKAFDHFNGQANYLDNIIEFANALSIISQILLPSHDEEGRQNMVAFHRLTACFYNKPEQLYPLITKIREAAKGDTSKEKFLLKLASERIQDNEDLSLESFTEILSYIATSDSDRLYNFMQENCKPPCMPLREIAEKIRTNGSFDDAAEKDLATHYQQHMMTPFGERNLQYAFNREEFNEQKPLFNDVDQQIFSDDIGHQINTLTTSLRQEPVQTLRNNFAALKKAALESKGELQNTDKLKLLCVCAEMLARTASQKDPVTGNIISQEINTTQMMALYALLTTGGDIRKILKILSQIDTGEGKSRITIILAACMVAMGKTVDLLTSDLVLSEREYLIYCDFFASLSIPTAFISLTTPPQLYQIKGVNFSDYSQLMLIRNRSDIDGNPEDWLDPITDDRCLLIDEVDKFVHDKSRDAYNYADRSAALSGFTWIYPFLVNYARTNHSPNPDLDPNTEAEQFVAWLHSHTPDPMQITAAANLLKENPAQLKTWIKSAHTAIGMTREVDYATTETLFPVIDTENNIRLSRKVLVLDNGRAIENSTFSGGVHQCLCAIENMENRTEDFVILPENKTLRRSFPVSFLQKYKNIFGFSGTTRGELRSLNNEINYERYTYFTVPRHHKLIRDDRPVWGAAGKSQQFEFIKREILKTLREGRPVLLICRDDRQSSELFQQISRDADIQRALPPDVRPPTRVHSLTSKEAETEAVRLAGTPGQITLSTAGMFSRGVDIYSDNLYVIATYVCTQEDEMQIKGRTGRVGKPGTYRMIPDVTDPDSRIDGTTYSLEKALRKTQRQMSSENITEEEISKLYALFLEKVHKKFLASYAKPSCIDQKAYLEKWADYLDKLNTDWNTLKQPLLTHIDNKALEPFKNQFAAFVEKWSAQIPLVNPDPIDPDDEDSLAAAQDTYRALISYRNLPAPSFTKKIQSKYDVSDDGQTRIYSSLFAQELALLRGERPWFANFRAWKEGRGTLFPDLQALLAGDRPLFANLRATVAWLIEAVNQHLAQYNHPQVR